MRHAEREQKQSAQRGSMGQYDPAEFLKQLAPHILAELQPPAGLKLFTTNPAIIGDYVEAGVRQLVRRYLSPIRVSKGAVIDQSQSPGHELACVPIA